MALIEKWSQASRTIDRIRTPYTYNSSVRSNLGTDLTTPIKSFGYIDIVP